MISKYSPGILRMLLLLLDRTFLFIIIPVYGAGASGMHNSGMHNTHSLSQCAATTRFYF